MGSRLISLLVENDPKITLVCPADRRSFYEQYGFKYIGKHTTPATPEFSLSKDLYSGLCFMQNYDENIPAPMFHLNDNDIRKILGH